MAIAPTVKYFGSAPTTIIMQSSSNFDGSAQTGDPVITPGLYTFPAQAAGGKFDFHEEAVKVLNVVYRGGGTLTIKKVFKLISGTPKATVGTVSSEGAFNTVINLAPGEYLEFTSAGGTNPMVEVTSQLAYVPSLGG